jgi:Spy/CpxP family protein refolding chaperone
MRRSLKLAAILILTVSGAALPIAFAQDPAPSAKPPAGQKEPADAASPTAPAKERDRLEIMKEQLALTPEQVVKIKPIVERDKARTRQLLVDKSLAPADRQKKLNALMKGSLDEIIPLLTPEQQAKWKEYKSRQRAARENK